MKTKRNQLPEMCYTALETTGALAVIKKNQNGFFPCSGKSTTAATAKETADLYNSKLELTPPQIKAMIWGSAFGWDTRMANPQAYFDDAVLLKSYQVTGYLKNCSMSIDHPVHGKLYHYLVADKELLYLDPAAIVAISDQYLKDFSMDGCLELDLVAGNPLLAVIAEKNTDSSFSFQLEKNVSSKPEINADYSICCRVDVGEVQYVLAVHTIKNAIVPFVNWERTPKNEPAGSMPSYYWGHYLSNGISGIIDFVDRVKEKYQWQKRLNLR